MIRVQGFAPKLPSGSWGSELPSFEAPDGAIVSIIGPSGSGKTRFSLFLSGLSGGNQARGAATLNGVLINQLSDKDRARHIAYIPSDPTFLFSGIKTSLHGEMNLSWQLLGEECIPARDNIADTVRLFRLEQLMHRDPFELSGGEAVRAAVALAVMKKPILVVVDQAYEHLDPESVVQIRAAVHTFLPSSSVIVETYARAPVWHPGPRGSAISQRQPGSEPDPRSWTVGIYSRIDVMPPSQLGTGQTVPTRASSPKASKGSYSQPRSRRLLNVEGLTFRYPRSEFTLGPLRLAINAGERIALVGPNGVGKTTLLKCLAMLLIPEYDRLEVVRPGTQPESPPDRWHLHKWARLVLYSFQRADDQLYLPTVGQELTETARRLGRIDFQDRANGIARHLGLEPLLHRSPFELPRSYRRLITIAAALVAAPPLLLLDEPSAALDEAQTKALIEVLLAYHPPEAAMLIISHDPPFISAASNRLIRMCDPRMLQVVNPASAPMYSIQS